MVCKIGSTYQSGKTCESTYRSIPQTNQDKRSCPHDDRFHIQSVNLIDRSTLVYYYIGTTFFPGFVVMSTPVPATWVRLSTRFRQPGSGRPGSGNLGPAGRFLRILEETASTLEFPTIFYENQRFCVSRNM